MTEALFTQEDILPELPEPERGRFVPLRAGIVNVWQYDLAEFHFNQGRMILRGENGAGKSKALELLLPFLLDADLSPRRLDPFAGTARTMRWNLLEGDQHESRVGYVWIEFGRIDADGSPEYVSLGAGLRALKSGSGADSWYFVTPQRIGRDFSLITPTGHPLSKADLRDVVDGMLFDRGGDYRAHVDKVLYGLGPDRFGALRHLLLQLRRPQLSEKLDTEALSSLLSESLPPVDDDLIGQLSEGFERLERDKDELVRIENSIKVLGRFLRVYRDYCLGVARAIAGDVRSGESSYQQASAQVNEVESALGMTIDQLKAFQIEADQSRERRSESLGIVRALKESQAWSAAKDLQLKHENCLTLERQLQQHVSDFESAQASAAHQERLLQGREAHLREARDVFHQRLERASAAAQVAVLLPVHSLAIERINSAVPEQVVDKIDAKARAAIDATVRAAIEERQTIISELRALVIEYDKKKQLQQEADSRKSEAESAFLAAGERSEQANNDLVNKLEQLDSSLLAWAGGLTTLCLDHEDLDRLRMVAARDDVSRGDRGDPGLADVLAEVAVAQRDTLVTARIDLVNSRRAVIDQRQSIQDEHARVSSESDLSPEPPRTRGADRTERPGAPLYMLCDFRDHLSEQDRASLEASLEASGLLDAWVTPEGKLLEPDTYDEVIVPSPITDAPTLTQVLVVDESNLAGGVSKAHIEAILGSVALLGIHDEATARDSLPHRVGPDGSWRLGPLHGAWAKPAAQFIGTSARARARQRRLNELADQLSELSASIDLLAQDLSQADAEIVDFDDQVRALPTTNDVSEARHRFRGAQADEERRRTELDQAIALVAKASAASDRVGDQLKQRASVVGLEAQVGDLVSHANDLYEYRSAFAEVMHALDAVCRAVELDEQAKQEAERIDGQVQALQARLNQSRTAATTARAEIDMLEATIGMEASQVVARHDAEVKKLETLETELEQLTDSIGAQREEMARVQERVGHAKQARDQADTQRRSAAQALRRVGETGILALVIEGRDTTDPTDSVDPAGQAQTADSEDSADISNAADSGDLTDPWDTADLAAVAGSAAGDSPAQHEQDLNAGFEAIENWSYSRLLELARAVEAAASSLDCSIEALDRRANAMQSQFMTLDGELGDDFKVFSERHASVDVVRVQHNNHSYDTVSINKILEDEAVTRRGLLEDRERDLLRKFLLGEVGSHLRGRLREARLLIDEMNTSLEECATASGLRLKLQWQPRRDIATNISTVIGLLRSDTDLLTDSQASTITAFLQDRIMAARENTEVIPWVDHLLQALDYRLWHQFGVLIQTPETDEWVALTKQGHSAKSGGEKSVALHLPLFAAVAAHYRSAAKTAPRLIMLDEAFAGIDQGMRGRCMGLLVDFDLDFLMTSHDDWGCYEELPGVAIYQLYRAPGMGGGVATIRFVWNGSTLNEYDPNTGQLAS